MKAIKCGSHLVFKSHLLSFKSTFVFSNSILSFSDFNCSCFSISAKETKENPFLVKEYNSPSILIRLSSSFNVLKMKTLSIGSKSKLLSKVFLKTLLLFSLIKLIISSAFFFCSLLADSRP